MFYFGLAMLGSWDQPRVRGPRDRFTESVRGWLNRFDSIVHLIVWVTAATFLVQLLWGLVEQPELGRETLFDWLFALSWPGMARGFVWQPLTYMLLHGNIWHILINLLVLWFFGREVEYFIGPKHFTRLYLLGGLAGAGLWLAFNVHAPTYLVGASAAVLGCVIAFATLFPDRDVTLLVFFVLPVTLKAKYLALMAVAVDVWPLLSSTDTSVAHLAHLGGAALGYLYIKHLGYGRTPRWLLWLQNAGRSLRVRRPRAKPVPQSPEEFIRREVDPILDKIAREGMHSLTRHERKILESAKNLMQKQRR